MWSPATRPLSVKLLHFIDAEGNPAWARADDEALGQKLGAFRHTRATPLASVHGNEPCYLGLHELWWPKRTDFHRTVYAAPKALQELLARAGHTPTHLVQGDRLIRVFGTRTAQGTNTEEH